MKNLWCVLAMVLAGCSSTPGLTSLADAEQFSKSRGVELVKVNDYKPVIEHVSAAANYTAGEVKLHVLQFETSSDAENWLAGIRVLSMDKNMVQHGPIVFAIDRGPDAELAKVKEALK